MHKFMTLDLFEVADSCNWLGMHLQATVLLFNKIHCLTFSFDDIHYQHTHQDQAGSEGFDGVWRHFW